MDEVAPEMADVYRQKVTTLAHALEAAETRTEALRGLIDAITLIPEEGVLRIELRGNLPAMLKAAQAQSTGAPLAPLDVGETRGRQAMTTSCR